MCKKEDIPFHHYSETYKYVNIKDGHLALSIDPNFPFIVTQFDLMSHRAQAEIPHRHDYFEIIFLEDGSGKHIIDFEPNKIKDLFIFYTQDYIYNTILKYYVIFCLNLKFSKPIYSS